MRRFDKIPKIWIKKVDYKLIGSRFKLKFKPRMLRSHELRETMTQEATKKKHFLKLCSKGKLTTPCHDNLKKKYFDKFLISPKIQALFFEIGLRYSTFPNLI